MEADEVYSQLSDKISTITDKLSEFQGTIDSLQSSIAEQKTAQDKTQSDLDQIKTAINDLKSATGTSKQDTSQQTQSLFDLQKKIEDANAASEKRYNDQQGMIGKLSNQAEDAAKMLVNFPDTMKGMATKAWEDGKKEILNTWETSKNDIMNSISGVTTDLIKKAKTGIKEEIQADLKSLVMDDVKDVQATQPPPLSDEDFETKVRGVMTKVASEK